MTEAVNRGYKDIVMYLVEHGADVNAKNDFDYTPLIVAAKRGHENIVTYLVEHGADVNVKDKDDITPLMWGALHSHINIVNFLILFTNKDYLKKYSSMAYGFSSMAYGYGLLNQNMRDFIEWILNNSPRKDLEKNAVRFARLAFAMPHFVAEFEMLFKLLGKDYTKLFTADVIERALLTQNIKAFEILIDKARKDNNSNLLKLISVEVEKFPKTNFNQKFFAQLKDLLGAKISGMEKAKNVYFGFE